MGTLLIILLCLFAALALMVKLTEKHGNKISAEQQQKLSKIIIPLIGVLLVARLFQHYWEG